MYLFVDFVKVAALLVYNQNMLAEDHTFLVVQLDDDQTVKMAAYKAKILVDVG